MLSRETLESYRRITPGERLTLVLQAMRESQGYLLLGPEDVVARRFELLRRENDARNKQMLTRLAAAEFGGSFPLPDTSVATPTP